MLPVRVKWGTGKEENIGHAVILRKTPSGMLVVRLVGEGVGSDNRFKWQGSGKFTQCRETPVDLQRSPRASRHADRIHPDGPKVSNTLWACLLSG